MKYLKYEIVVKTDINTSLKRVHVYSPEGDEVYTSEETEDDFTEINEARFWIVEKVLK